jgi:protein-tyrosine phosphatase
MLRDDLDIATVIDLRARSEAEREGIGRIGALGRAHQFIPIVRESAGYSYHVPSRTDLDAQYFEIVLDAGDAVIDIVRLLAGGRATPAILHCAAGKDRTGIVTSLVLSLLGVVRDQVVADYARSGMHMDAVVTRLRQLPSYGARVDMVPAGVWSADPVHMEGLLRRIDDRFGSVRAWAASMGLEDETVTALRSHLLEDADETW